MHAFFSLNLQTKTNICNVYLGNQHHPISRLLYNFPLFPLFYLIIFFPCQIVNFSRFSPFQDYYTFPLFPFLILSVFFMSNCQFLLFLPLLLPKGVRNPVHFMSGMLSNSVLIKTAGGVSPWQPFSKNCSCFHGDNMGCYDHGDTMATA